MKVAFATLGCKVNQYDTGAIETALLSGGDTIVPFDEGADVYVVNTCTVTDRADAECRRLARRARRFNPAARVVLTGCFAQTSPAKAALPEVDYVIGIGRLADVLRAVRGNIGADEGRVFVDDVRKANRVSTLGAEVFGGQTRAFLKIQEGCDLFCTFCIVPFARGKSRSVEPRRVLGELRTLAERGFQEVVLTGVHLGGYGADLDAPIALADLLEMIAELRPVARVRLSSIDPPEVNGRLLEILSKSDVFCHHLHVPVQAGADAVLRRMRRQYDTALLQDVFSEVARVLPDVGIGTDVIAGFPGESEADFHAGVELVRQLPFSYLHVFPYSQRTGTTAARLGGHLEAAQVTARAKVLRRVGSEKRRAFADRFLGRDLRVLFESARDRESGLLAGYSRNYVRVLLAGGDALGNQELAVRAVERRGDRLLATVPGERRQDAGAPVA